MPLTPLASANDFQAWGSNAQLVQNTAVWTPTALDTLMTRATRSVESRCDRRLAAFTGLLETSRADGVDTDGLADSDFPLDLVGALGRSQARAYGATSLVRDVWLREYAPVYADLWATTVSSIQLVLAYGGTYDVDPGSVEGPEPDTGHLRFRLGTFVPAGTTVRVTYSGGYTTVPDDLEQATILQATKLVLLAAEPELRTGMSTADLDAEILMLLDPYIRY